MDNKLPCNKCRFYDVIIRGADKETKRGWCIKRSKYPFREGPGQVFPPGVARVDAGQLAEPFIVKGTDIIATCLFVQPADQPAIAAKRARIEVLNKEGRRILS